MDFCFMFDAQNIEGKKLNSTEQYLDHAATCIYAQSIGPMNTRSNSSEDNVIRTLVSGKSRNRYAGAGASELVYPSDHIIQYIALKWAVQTVAEHWTVFDRDFKRKSTENNRARLKGHGVSEIKQETEYTNSVDAAADRDSAFAMSVKNASYFLDKDGFTITGNKWNNYIDALFDYIKKRASSGQGDIDGAQTSAQSKVEGIFNEGKPDMETFRDAYNLLITYKELVQRHVGDIGRVAAYELFKPDEDGISEENPTQIETYMKDNSKEFMHPNAARYFLYQTLLALNLRCTDIENQNKTDKDSFKAFDTMFAEETDDSIKNIGDFQSRITERNFIEVWFKKHEGTIKPFIDRYEGLLESVARYRVNAPYELVLKGAIKYVRNLCEAFESFYTSFDSYVADINRQINVSEDKYSLNKGNTIRYVCASKKCLDQFYEKMQFTGSALQLPGDLCMQIYKHMKQFTHATEGKVNTFFNDIFDKVILKHFKDSVAKNYGKEIKMDIIQALEVEAEYEKGEKEHSRVVEYVKQVIRDTKQLADPFINRPIGEEPVKIPACAYNKNLITDNPERRDLVLSELKSFGGVGCDDDEINTEKILFYSAIYGLFPNDLLKFSPPKKSLTVTLEAGEYYKSYYDLINRIEPDTLTTPVITPHLHKHWHLISEMPELNNELQTEQEKLIYKALVLGILYERIRYEAVGDKFKYSLWLKKSSTEVKLENLDGMQCENFHQVIDALTINPVTVRRILNAIDDELESVRRNNVIKFEQSALYKGIIGLTLRELSGDSRPMSIFGIAAAFKAKTPPDEFIPEQGQMLLETILETLYEQMGVLCPQNERGDQYKKLIKSQLKLFTDNFEFYRQVYPSILDDYLRILLHVVIKVLYEKELNEAANEVVEFTKRQFSESAPDKPKTAK
jgi:hypothetical protein